MRRINEEKLKKLRVEKEDAVYNRDLNKAVIIRKEENG